MAWIKIGKHDILNLSAIKSIEITRHNDNSYYIKFSLYECDSILSNRFEQYEECFKLFNKVCNAVMNNASVDIS